MSGRATSTATRLAAICGTVGTLHFVTPQAFDQIIPPALPGPPRAWTYGSGVAEYATTALLLHPRTRRRAGRLATLLFLGVFPGNLQMAWNWRHKPWYMQAISLGRLPLQAHLITQAELVHREA